MTYTAPSTPFVPAAVRCTVYRSSRKEYTYLYLAEGREWDDLPGDLQRMFGEPVEVMHLDVDATTRLARADVGVVRKHLEEVGYHVQLPPRQPLEDEIGAGISC